MRMSGESVPVEERPEQRSVPACPVNRLGVSVAGRVSADCEGHMEVSGKEVSQRRKVGIGPGEPL